MTRWILARCRQAQTVRHGPEPFVQRPQVGAVDRCRSKQMDVDPADPSTHHPSRLDERQRLLMLYDRDGWQLHEVGQDGRAIGKTAAGQLAHNEGMCDDEVVVEKRPQREVIAAEMIDPD